jgi:transcription antitermination protein NusB
MSSRRKVRECALQLLFQCDVNRQDPETTKKLYWTNTRRSGDQELQDSANKLFGGTVDHLEEIDETVKRHSENWRMDRMAAVDRNILRLAVHEMTSSLWPEMTPPVVVIDEALDIARRFSGEAAVPFINGILDSVRKSLTSENQ